MPIFTKAAEALVLSLAKKKAIDRESAVTIPSAAVASRLIDFARLEKATRKRGGASQTTVYWLTEMGREMAKDLAAGPKCRSCGCSNLNPCARGCGWLEPDLCDAPECAKKAKKK